MGYKELLQHNEIRRFVILCSLVLSVILFVWVVIELQFTLLEVVLLLYVAVDLFEDKLEYIYSVVREII